jgi:phospholipid/cholesterol/gamma-HCH transport system substrate-binding protein
MSRTSTGIVSDAAKHKVLGIGFLALVVLFTWLTYAIFSKTFVDYDEVELQSSKTGLQLPARADIKIRGAIVGEVLDMTTEGENVSLTLGLFPSETESIPSNVSARILPKTLFGEKYVALQIPEQPSSDPIAAGDVIKESEVSIEVEKVLSDLYPLLRTVQPAELNYTLNAISTALEGRGEAIGNNFVVLNDYLKRMNPQIPEMVEDLRLLSEVSDVYRSVVPEITTTLRNSVKTGNTFIEKEQKIQALFADIAGFSNTTRDFVEQNGQNIIRLSQVSPPILGVFAKYSPEYPCLLKGITRGIPKQAQTFRGYTLHINLEMIERQPRGFTPGDDPRFGDKRGPINLGMCQRAINGVYGQNNLPPLYFVPNVNDGVDRPTGKKGQSRVAPGFAAPQMDLTSGLAGTAAEREVVDAIVAPVLGVPRDEVPDVTSLLFGPLARGAEVGLR